jgi:hypothetical protein
VIRPALADRKGRALIMGTPRGRMNMLYDLSKTRPDDPEWSYHCYTALQTGMIAPEELEGLRRDMPEAMFQQEMLCDFNAALLGAIYGKEVNALTADGRFTLVKYDETLPVYTAWDLGYSDATAIVYAQMVGSEVWIIDYDEFTLTNLVEIAKVVNGKPYTYGAHFGPHDLWVHELGSGNSRADILSRMGLEFEPAVNWSLEDGIEATRLLLKNLWIDSTNAERLLECVSNYVFKFDDTNRRYLNTPLHSYASHGSDALRYLAVHLDKSARPKASKRSRYGEAQGWLI